MKEQVVWGIHAGRTGDANSLFLKNSVVAIGWHEMGDLSKIACNRETFKARVTNVFPLAKPGAIPGMAGQLFRFVCEMKLGDLVLYPSKLDREVHFGQIEGEYFYDSQGSPSYPNRRTVKWLKSVPRTQFTQGALYELGAAMSLFQVKNYPEEYRAVLSGSAVAEPVDEDETVAVIAEEIEESTRDFILKTLAQEVKGHPFSHFVANLLRTMGYRTRVSPEGPDGGIDIVAHKDELGFEPPIIKVQAKSGDKGNVGEPVVSALYGKVGQSEFGMVVTLGGFTTQAINFAKGKGNLRLISGNELVDLILSRYELLDSGYKGMLPLRRVYVPEPLGSKQQSGILL
ncbi:MAG TPA: restriction endonuclease [Acidobacteriaceae bacterium]|nr:restriction endonuclease [Acidobacteriaceae bacterium]